jgi:phenylacetaldehyde dehydrogenase
MTVGLGDAPVDVAAIKGKGAQLMLIGGKRLAAVSGRTIDVHDPATGLLIGTSPDGDARDVDRAVEAAARSFDGGIWRGLHGAQRARVLWRAADLIDEHARELAELEALNSGMLFAMAQQMIALSAEVVRYYAGWATKIHGITTEMSTPAQQFHAFTLRDPIGVCAFIVPWNVPVPLTVNKLAPALAAGCSCVVKPSEETPFTALRVAELFQEAGVPEGVINVVTGYGHTAGAALAAHEKVAKIAFTGSTEVGKLIVKAAAGNLKKVTLELGGKSPVIVFDDCNLEKAVFGAAMGVFLHAGQICIAGSRLYVQRKSFDRVVSGIAEVAKGMKLGNCFDPTTQIGPLISAKQLERVTQLITSGLDEGAELVTGGKRTGEKGYFVEPTIFARPRPDSRIVKEEIFGPVLTATPFDDIDEIVKTANDTSYGLASAVWTNDINKAHYVAKKLQAGFVWINCAFVSDPSLPGGGYKQSGWGRELGQEGLDAYLQTKSVFAALG